MAAVATQQLPQALPLDLVKNQSVISASEVSLSVVLRTLKQQLSASAAIYLPQDEAFELAVKRFSDYRRPLPGAVVCPVTESDIVATVSISEPLHLPIVVFQCYDNELIKLNR
jgi:hypothetical protein